MAELTTIARPYAKAVFELARDAGTLDGWSDTLAFLAEVVANDTVSTLIANPGTSDAELLELFEAAAGDKLGDESRNFLRLLIANDRLPVLGDIATTYEELKAEAEGIVDVDVTSAEPVGEDYKQSIGKALRSKLGREVQLNFYIDPDLIGGALIRAGDLVIDGTVKGRLEGLTGALAD